MAITFEILTPRGVVFQSEAKSVRLPGVAGEFGVLPGHVPFITALQAGVIELDTTESKHEKIAVSAGFVEVLPEKVIVLAETAETAANIDVTRADAARKRAEDGLRNATDRGEAESYQAALARAKARIKAKTNS